MLHYCSCYCRRKKKASTSLVNLEAPIKIIPPNFKELTPEQLQQLTADVQPTSPPDSPQPKGVPATPTPKPMDRKPVSRGVGFKKTTGRRKGGLSITGMLQEKHAAEEEAKEEDLQNKPSDKFTAEDLHKAWANYANRVKNNGKSSLFATLTKHQPAIAANFVIEFTIDNAVQEELMTTERLELMDYLRSTLNNYQLQLKTIINKSEQKNTAYTTRDKFNKMAEKNPALHTLKDLLRLDLDY